MTNIKKAFSKAALASALALGVLAGFNNCGGKKQYNQPPKPFNHHPSVEHVQKHSWMKKDSAEYKLRQVIGGIGLVVFAAAFVGASVYSERKKHRMHPVKKTNYSKKLKP